jgi:GR25 family glycosyltransferase involved in LPS biosynthesis
MDALAFFNDIVCINLRSRQDRRQYMASLLKRLGIPCRFHIVTKHPKGGRYGCFESHIQVIQECYNKGDKYIMIIEDDILPSQSYSNTLFKHAIQFMKSHKYDWDIFYLGYIPMDGHLRPHSFLGCEVVSKHIVKFNPLATHAYCLQRSGMKLILDNYKTNIGKVHFDIFLSRLGPKMRSFCIIPMLFEQKLCFAHDNSTHTPWEWLARTMQCDIEKNTILHRISMIKYQYHQHTLTCIMAFMILLSMFVCVLVYSV